MNRYKCKNCGGNQYTSDPDRENEACIYCGNEGTVLMDTLDEKPGENEGSVAQYAKDKD